MSALNMAVAQLRQSRGEKKEKGRREDSGGKERRRKTLIGKRGRMKTRKINERRETGEETRR